jgi:hypothetical protein
MTVGSCFSGIGGFDLGFERAGFEIKWQCEIDPWCRAVLEKHWPGVTRYHDVRTIGSEAEWVDVIFGGWPCQPVASASRVRRRGTQITFSSGPENRLLHSAGPLGFICKNVTHSRPHSSKWFLTWGTRLRSRLRWVPACAFGLIWRRRLWFLCHATGAANQGCPSMQVAGVPPPEMTGRGSVGWAIRGLDARRMAALGSASSADRRMDRAPNQAEKG